MAKKNYNNTEKTNAARQYLMGLLNSDRTGINDSTKRGIAVKDLSIPHGSLIATFASDKDSYLLQQRIKGQQRKNHSFATQYEEKDGVCVEKDNNGFALFLDIYKLDSKISDTQIMVKEGRRPISYLKELEKQCDCLILQTARYGVDVEAPSRPDLRVAQTLQFTAWYNFHIDHFTSYPESKQEFIMGKHLGGESVRLYQPQGNWYDSLPQETINRIKNLIIEKKTN